MTTNTTAALQTAARDDVPTATDPRDDTLLVGVDTDGCHHLLKTEGTTDTLLVVEDATVVWRVDDINAEAWMDHIAAARGWADRRLGAFHHVYATELATLRGDD